MEMVSKIFQIIKDYRKEDGDFMSEQVIADWVNQFDEKDKAFILEEMFSILSKRYITREEYKEYLRTTFFKDIVGLMKSDYKESDIKSIFQRSHFINEQPEGKSQKAVMRIFEEVLQEELGLKLDDCGKEEPLCCIYLDDILCTGDTIFKAIAAKEGWLNKSTVKKGMSNRTFLEEKNIPLFVVFYTIHKSNRKKLDFRIRREQKDHKIKTWYFWQDGHEIDNDVTDASSALQFLYPLENTKNNLAQLCKKHIKEKVTTYCKEKSYSVPKSNFYRSAGTPKAETLFSSSKNRNRFEEIILNKSIELYNKANSFELRMRPLGYGLYTDMSFGFGTLVFSWRNVPFNTPLVFWYEHKGWTPLFKRKYSSYSPTFKQIMKGLS